MNVCIVGYRGNPYSGGQGVYIYNLVRELAHLGHTLDVIVGPPYPLPLDDWAHVHHVPNFNLWGRYDGAWLPARRPLALFRPWHFFDFAATRARFFPEPFSFSMRALGVLARLLRRRRPDIVHDVQSLGYGTLAMRAFGLPLVTTVHHPLSIDRRESFARDRGFMEAYHTAAFYPVAMQGFVARRLERVITASQAGRTAIARDFRVPPSRIVVVSNGLDTTVFRNPGCGPREQATLLFVGNTDDVKKGAVHLLHALRLLPEHVLLRIVDEPYPAKVLLHREVRRLGLEARVTFTGKLSTEALVREYCRCALLVQPSLFEGFGLPAAEALACGTPVVATAVGAVGEVIPAGAGLLVPAAAAEALAAAIAELLAMPRGALEAMGARGRRHVEQHFAWPVAARRTAEVYAQVVAEQRAGVRR